MSQIVNHVAPIIVILIVLVLVSFRSQTTHFECPKCHSSFKVSGLTFSLTPHVGGSRYVKCPDCGYRGMMPTVND